MKQRSSLRTSRSLLFACVSVSFFSCSSVQHFRQDTYAARDADKKSFVQKKDGTVIEANEAVLRTPLFGKATIELDRNTKVAVKEIEAYQNSSAYYRRISGQFAPRIKKGPINMYQTSQTYQEYSGGGMGRGYGMYGSSAGYRTRTRILYYLQKGDSAKTELFSPSVTRDYVQDYAPAMEFINVYDANRKKYKIWSYINTAATLGGLVLAGSKGLDNNDDVTTAGYVGTGLFVGGFVNGVVNKIRKARNYKNLEVSIDTYNGRVVKKKRRP